MATFSPEFGSRSIEKEVFYPIMQNTCDGIMGKSLGLSPY
jgi:hypothetical protein